MDDNSPVLTNTCIAKVPTTGIQKLNTGSEIVLYPNPCSDVLNFSNAVLGSSFSLYALDGRLLSNVPVITETLQLNDLSLPIGSYIYRIEMGKTLTKSGILIKN
jgi:hypothetical protein